MNPTLDSVAFGWSADDAHFFFAETLPDGSQTLKVRSESDTEDEQTILPHATGGPRREASAGDVPFVLDTRRTVTSRRVELALELRPGVSADRRGAENQPSLPRTRARLEGGPHV